MLRGCRSGQPLPDYDAVARRLHTTGAVDTVPTGSAVSAGLAPDDLQEVDSAPIEVDGSAVPRPAAGWSAVGRAGPGVYLAWQVRLVGDRLAAFQLAVKPNEVDDPAVSAPL
jgi:hypothetical protein